MKGYSEAGEKERRKGRVVETERRAKKKQFASGFKLQSWTPAVAAAFLGVLSTSGSFKSLIDKIIHTACYQGRNW